MIPAGELVRLELGNQIAVAVSFLAADRETAARFGTAVDSVAGLPCPTCRVWDAPLFNRIIGAGVLGPLDAAGLDAIVAHFNAKERTPCVEVYEELTPPEVVGLLDGAGFAPSGHGYESHLLETDRAPEVERPGVTVRRCETEDWPRFAALVADGFGATGELGEFFTAATIAAVADLGADTAAFIAAVDGEDAGTGQLVLTPRIAGCYSGSVLPAYRGRGIQHALVVARIAEGLARGRRIFVSQTDPDSASGHNLHDLGFRTLYRASWYVRPG